MHSRCRAAISIRSRPRRPADRVAPAAPVDLAGRAHRAANPAADWVHRGTRAVQAHARSHSRLPHHRRIPRTDPMRTRGFTLIELMVAIFITALVAAMGYGAI